MKMLWVILLGVSLVLHSNGQGLQPAGPPHALGMDDHTIPPGSHSQLLIPTYLRPPPGDSIGFTYYDYGSNGSSMRNIINYGDGTLSFARMSAVDMTTDTRGSYYKVFDGTSWSTGWVRVENTRRGWTNLVAWRDLPGTESVMAHSFEINTHDGPGGAWISDILPCVLNEWPRLTIGSGSTLHAIATTGVGYDLGYHRSLDGGSTWECDRVLYSSGYSEADGYDIAADGDDVAIVIAGAGNDVVLLESTDGGSTWDEEVIYDVDESLTTPGEGPPDGSCSVLYDIFGNAHAVWGNYYSDGSGTLLLSAEAGIRHWSAATGVQEVAFGDPNPEIIHHRATDGNYISQPMLAADSLGRVFIVYSRFVSEQDVNQNFYQHVFAIASFNSGETWEPEIDLTPGGGFDASFPSVAALVDDSLHVVYMGDPLAGNWLLGTHAQIAVAHMHRAVHREEILGPFPPPAQSSPPDGAVAQPTDIAISWIPAEPAEAYHLQLSTEITFTNPIVDDSTITSTMYTVTDLDSSTVHYWRIRARYEEGTSRWTTIWTFRTVERPPLAPLLISPPDGSSDHPTTLTLVWDVSSYARDYRVQVAQDSLFLTILVDDSPLTTTSLLLEGLNTNAQYFWRVNARNTSFTSPWSAEWEFSTGETVIPVTPLLYDPQDGATNQSSTVTLLWYPSVGSDHYHLQVSQDDVFTTPFVDDSTLYGTWHIVEDLDLETYFWRVRGLNENGSSPWSQSWSFTVGSLTEAQDQDVVTREFLLSQNYPNPFNPMTNISFSIPQSSVVNLTIFDLLGREVATIVDEKLAPGTYSREWNPTGLASGVYLYRLTAGDFVETRKLVLIR